MGKAPIRRSWLEKPAQRRTRQSLRIIGDESATPLRPPPLQPTPPPPQPNVGPSPPSPRHTLPAPGTGKRKRVTLTLTPEEFPARIKRIRTEGADVGAGRSRKKKAEPRMKIWGLESTIHKRSHRHDRSNRADNAVKETGVSTNDAASVHLNHNDSHIDDDDTDVIFVKKSRKSVELKICLSPERRIEKAPPPGRRRRRLMEDAAAWNGRWSLPSKLESEEGSESVSVKEEAKEEEKNLRLRDATKEQNERQGRRDADKIHQTLQVKREALEAALKTMGSATPTVTSNTTVTTLPLVDKKFIAESPSSDRTGIDGIVGVCDEGVSASITSAPSDAVKSEAPVSEDENERRFQDGVARSPIPSRRLQCSSSSTSTPSPTPSPKSFSALLRCGSDGPLQFNSPPSPSTAERDGRPRIGLVIASPSDERNPRRVVPNGVDPFRGELEMKVSQSRVGADSPELEDNADSGAAAASATAERKWRFGSSMWKDENRKDGMKSSYGDAKTNGGGWTELLDPERRSTSSPLVENRVGNRGGARLGDRDDDVTILERNNNNSHNVSTPVDRLNSKRRRRHDSNDNWIAARDADSTLTRRRGAESAGGGVKSTKNSRRRGSGVRSTGLSGVDGGIDETFGNLKLASSKFSEDSHGGDAGALELFNISLRSDRIQLKCLVCNDYALECRNLQDTSILANVSNHVMDHVDFL